MVICWKLRKRERLTLRISVEEAVIKISLGIIIPKKHAHLYPQINPKYKRGSLDPAKIAPTKNVRIGRTTRQVEKTKMSSPIYKQVF